MRTFELIARRLAAALLFLAASSLSACQVDEKGIAGQGVSVDRPPDAAARRPSPPPTSAPAGTPASDAGAPSPALADAAEDVAPATSASPDAGDVAPADGAPPGPTSIAPPARCIAGPDPRPTVKSLGAGPKSDDIAFDRDGHMISFDGRDLVRVFHRQMPEVLAYDVIGNRGGTLRALPGGEILLADFERDAALLRAPSGQIRRLPGTVQSPMKMVRGPRGHVYITGKQGVVSRVNEADGTVTTLATTAFELGGLTFSADYKVLYLGAIRNSAIYAMDLGADGKLGPPRMFAAQISGPQALAADECGNLYAISEGQNRVRRVSATGQVTTLADIAGAYPWSLAFGSGSQGWAATSLFVHDGRIFELPLGVAGQGPPPPAAATVD